MTGWLAATPEHYGFSAFIGVHRRLIASGLMWLANAQATHVRQLEADHGGDIDVLFPQISGKRAY